MRGYVNWSKLAWSSSCRKERSSEISWSVHFLPDKALVKFNRFATTMAGKFSSGAFFTRFYSQQQPLRRLTRKMPITRRLIFSLMAVFEISMRVGMISCFLAVSTTLGAGRINLFNSLAIFFSNVTNQTTRRV